ncbi:MbnP family copper-binding protein [Marinobacter salexigens]|nr:MbnP family copper-binding protein [Marinobacter salexigens]
MGKKGLYCFIAGSVLLSGCGGSSSSSTETVVDEPTELTIPFKAMVGSDPMTCGQTFTGLGTNSASVEFEDFRMFISNVRLVTDQGEEIPFNLDPDAPGQNSQVALLDFRDTATVNETGDTTDVCISGTDDNPGFKDTLVGSAELDPEKTISHFEFTIGVPFEQNHADQSSAEEPLRNPGLASGMTWNWQNGYKFMAADVIPVGGITRPDDAEWSSTAWNLHLGSTGCEVGTSDLADGVAPEPCAADNRVEVSLPLGGFEQGAYAIKIDYAALISGSNLNQDGGGAPGCMSFAGDPECPAVFKNLALPFGEEQNDGGNPNAVVFSIVERQAL